MQDPWFSDCQPLKPWEEKFLLFQQLSLWVSIRQSSFSSTPRKRQNFVNTRLGPVLGPTCSFSYIKSTWKFTEYFQNLLLLYLGMYSARGPQMTLTLMEYEHTCSLSRSWLVVQMNSRWNSPNFKLFPSGDQRMKASFPAVYEIMAWHGKDSLNG